MKEYILYFIIGFIFGVFGTLLFFRFDKQWKQVLMGLFDFAGTSVVGVFAAEYFHIPGENRSTCFLVLLVGMMISVVVAFLGIAKLIQGDDSKIPIRKLDILLGYDKYLEQYYNERKNQTESYELDKIKKQLDIRNKSLEERESKFNQQTKEGVIIKLPENVDYPITNQFIGILPIYIEHLYAFRSNINDLTEQIINKLSYNEGTGNEADILKGYFAGIGMYVSNDLFGVSDSSNKEVRTHFRIYRQGNYVQYVVVEGNKMSSVQIHNIPEEKNSLIKKSYELRRSIIASLNGEDIYDVKTPWEDFMTITYYNIKHGDKPFLSMGISIKNRNQFFDLLAFLNYFKIEECIQTYIERVNQKCNIVKVLGGL